ncbi:SEL1-like repeat protein [Treponema phagedenis]|uniref:Sel1 repeat family protein n=1 Tax=Treponema phagedenis TaxID=162 RepID=A0A0B7GSH5_TREPH|nr:SEL1-like repeat protein [Treponema phagedenis]QEJ96464.1 sel1 repeat family protein [Treponema phagedenis]QEK02247.1 sel1 repeat family protein [Treponema phagedenis]QEK07835.1 sel1 repeat family protein [Treponema phagedenis]QSH94491.1 sel1 repeat family protein [Treponema phagedenis]CEM61549.1 conserved hypothetical protein [Treponema phagedenis]
MLNHKQVIYWMTKAAEQEDAFAQLMLGDMYLRGEVTLVDKKKAAYWIRKSYENGCDEAKKVWEKNKLWQYAD